MRKIPSFVTFWHKATLLSYSQILLSNTFAVGWFVIAAIALKPDMLIASLCATFAANGSATLLGFNRKIVETGYYGYNAILVGLCLAFSFDLNPTLVLLIIAGSLMTVFLTVGLTSLLGYYVHLPILSLPFILVTPIVWLIGEFLAIPEPSQAIADFSNLLLLNDHFNASKSFLRALGSILFMPHELSGLLLFVGLLLVSRIFCMLSIGGFLVGFSLLLAIDNNLEGIDADLLGFNSILTAVILGGVFVIPSLASYGLAIVATAICALTSLAMYEILDQIFFEASILTAPSVFTSLLILYALKFREHGYSPKLVKFIPSTPEKNMDYDSTWHKHLENNNLETFFSLPFNGEWKISQGIQGKYTHQDQWKYAWDFVVVDEKGQSFSLAGHKPPNYHAYRLPVLAPADGTVIRVVDQVPDNEIGIINTKDNWGNFVIIQHNAQLYSVLAHLSWKTIRVKEGNSVQRGNILGLCGNSGRSPEPHLHFHVQQSPNLGSLTICPTFSTFIRKESIDSISMVEIQAPPEEGDYVKNLVSNPSLATFLTMPIDFENVYKVTVGNSVKEERWKVSVDFNGISYIESLPTGAQASFSVHRGLFLILNYIGPTDTALFAFAVGASLVPLTSSIPLHWKNELPYSYFSKGTSKLVTDMIRPLFDLIRVSSQLKLEQFEGDSVGAQVSEEYRIEGETTVSTFFSKTNGKWKSRVVLNGNNMLYPMTNSVIPGPTYLELTSPYGWNLVAHRYKSSGQVE